MGDLVEEVKQLPDFEKLADEQRQRVVRLIDSAEAAASDCDAEPEVVKQAVLGAADSIVDAIDQAAREAGEV